MTSPDLPALFAACEQAGEALVTALRAAADAGGLTLSDRTIEDVLQAADCRHWRAAIAERERPKGPPVMVAEEDYLGRPTGGGFPLEFVRHTPATIVLRDHIGYTRIFSRSTGEEKRQGKTGSVYANRLRICDVAAALAIDWKAPRTAGKAAAT